MRQLLITAAGLLAAGLVAGCGNARSSTYRVSGAVTFDGRAIPAGQVVFTPDVAKKNEGPTAVAEIKNGRYETPTGKGVAGGPYLIKVTGLGDPAPGFPNGKPLCDYQVAVDLPTEHTTKDIEVPKSAEVKNPKPGDAP